MSGLYETLQASRILITGGAGFVGGNLVRYILKELNPQQVIIVDNLLSSEKFNIPNDSRILFYEGSIAEDSVLEKLNDDIDYVFHLATYHGNQSSIHDPIKDHENNTLTTLKLFNRLKNFKNIKKVVYSSAGCSVAKKTQANAIETDENAPLEIAQDSPYSISKIVGEFYSVYFFNQHSLPVVRARFQNVYGPGEFLGAGKWRGTPATVWRNVTPVFIYKAMNNIALPLENNGAASRDFIFVDDIVQGLLSCASKGVAGEVYNLASGKETTIKELAELINSLTGNKAGVELLPKRPWDNSGKRFGSTKKSKEALQFEAKTNFSDGIKATVKWTEQNMDLINKCISKHKSHLS